MSEPTRPCIDCGDTEETVYFERDAEWACASPAECMERQRDQAQQERDQALRFLRELHLRDGNPQAVARTMQDVRDFLDRAR